MKVIVVDDERIVLNAETAAVKRVLPDAEVFSFQKATEAVQFVKVNNVDIAFLGINIKGVTGLELAKDLQETNSRINIVFWTGYSEYSFDAHELYCSAYLLKPVTDEKLRKALDNLRFPVSENNKRLKVHCSAILKYMWMAHL